MAFRTAGILRKQSEDLEGKVAQLQKGMGVFSLGDTDTQGKPQIYSTVLDHLQQQTTALSAAEANRIMKGALYQVVKSEMQIWSRASEAGV